MLLKTATHWQIPRGKYIAGFKIKSTLYKLYIHFSRYNSKQHPLKNIGKSKDRVLKLKILTWGNFESTGESVKRGPEKRGPGSSNIITLG